MDRIYGSACLTIIAAAGNNPSHGLPGVSLRVNPSKSVRIGSRTFVTVGTDILSRNVKESKWNGRAWTMQEGFLSCRCLVFTEQGTYFQCRSPQSHRLEAIHHPPALLRIRHEVLTRNEHLSAALSNSLIMTKAGRDMNPSFRFSWCLELVKDYFTRSMSFEDDSLNAFLGILKHVQSLKPPIHNLWGVLMLPTVKSTSSGHRIQYNLACGLAWSVESSPLYFKDGFGKLDRPTVLPRKKMFPSWTWADWRSRTALEGENFTSRHELELPYPSSSFTPLSDLPVELDDGRIISLGQGYESDISWLAEQGTHPRILHIYGYTSHPQLRYMSEAEWGSFCERSIFLTQEQRDSDRRRYEFSRHHSSEGDSFWRTTDYRWVLIDADGEHLQQPFENRRYQKPWCWCQDSGKYALARDAYHFQMQRGHQTGTIKPWTESIFDLRIILLGYDEYRCFYMVLMKVPGTNGSEETFERVNVINRLGQARHAQELLVKLTGKKAP